jgi:hypothetical protein
MDTIFVPPKRRGLIFHLFVLFILIIGSILSILQANRVEVGAPFGLALIFLFLFLLPIPTLAYRAYALQRATYHLSPEGIRLNWGLRSEAIPMDKILWLSLDTHLERPLPLPWLRWPGGIIGIRQLTGGEVEYMAVQSHHLIIIATPGKMYAISPENPELFLQTFHKQTEIGTLHPISAHSIYPAFLLGNVWASWPARITIIAGLSLSLTLLIWITLTIPTDFGNAPFSIPNGNDATTILPSQILLLPVINALFFLVNFLLGLFFFRSPQSQPLAYLLWGASVLTSLLFFGAFYTFIQG